MTAYPLEIVIGFFLSIVAYWLIGLAITDDFVGNWNNWSALAFSFVWLPAFFFIIPYVATKAFINMRIWDQHNVETRS